jgi:hypothetical protein
VHDTVVVMTRPGDRRNPTADRNGKGHIVGRLVVA